MNPSGFSGSVICGTNVQLVPNSSTALYTLDAPLSIVSANCLPPTPVTPIHNPVDKLHKLDDE